MRSAAEQQGGLGVWGGLTKGGELLAVRSERGEGENIQGLIGLGKNFDVSSTWEAVPARWPESFSQGAAGGEAEGGFSCKILNTSDTDLIQWKVGCVDESQ